MKTTKKSKNKAITTHTHIAIVLDRSGSMASLKNEIIGGFNAFLKDQREVPGRATMTFVQFDHEIDRLADFKELAEIKNLDDSTYQPRGMTKLYDAIGLTVKTVKESIAGQAKKPEKVLVLILTDGLENSSEEYTTETIRALLTERQAAGWQFSFIGANQDAILTARGIGLNNAASNITYAANAKGTSNVLRSMSVASASFRCSTGADFAYNQADRDAQNLDPSAASGFGTSAAFKEHGSKFASSGGTARAASLTPKQRTAIASEAAKARWSKKSV